MASDTIDHRVGLSDMVGPGQRVEKGDPLALLHAADLASADRAAQCLDTMIVLGDVPAAPASVLVSASVRP